MNKTLQFKDIGDIDIQKPFKLKQKTDLNKFLVVLLTNEKGTDTRIVLYLQYATSIGFLAAVVRTPDSDVFRCIFYFAAPRSKHFDDSVLGCWNLQKSQINKYCGDGRKLRS